MPSIEKTSPRLAKIAAKGIRYPERLTTNEIVSVCASLLTQAPDKPKKAKSK